MASDEAAEDAAAMREVLRLAEHGLSMGERPFAAVIARDGCVLSASPDRVFAHNDPTAHAEMVAIRQACFDLRVAQLRGCTLYSLVEPCVMCCGATHWAKVDAIVFGVSQAVLNELSGGRAKPRVRDLLPLGSRSVEVRGGVLEHEALASIASYDFPASRL